MCNMFIFLTVLIQSDDQGIERDMVETVYGCRPSGYRNHVGGIEVLSGLRNVPFAIAMFLGLVYALYISYPPELKYTF